MTPGMIHILGRNLAFLRYICKIRVVLKLSAGNLRPPPHRRGPGIYDPPYQRGSGIYDPPPPTNPNSHSPVDPLLVIISKCPLDLSWAGNMSGLEVEKWQKKNEAT